MRFRKIFGRGEGEGIGLALGSGGARGLSEIGVLLWLKEQGISPCCVAGSSIGAILGAAIAAGRSPEYLRDTALDITWADKVKFLRPSLKGRSIFEWKRIGGFLEDIFEDVRIEDLEMPFACVATDIDTGMEFVFRQGRVLDAVTASAAIPGAFPPVEIKGMHLVDGQVVNPVPVDVAFDLGAKKVIGVNVCRSVHTERMMYDSEEPSLKSRVDGWVRTVIERNPLSRLGLIDSTELERKLDSLRDDRNVIDIITDSIAIISSRMMSMNLLDAGPHYLIRPEVGGYQDFDFEHAEDIIERGYRAAEESREEVLEFVGA